jgi:hypothetical protein
VAEGYTFGTSSDQCMFSMLPHVGYAGHRDLLEGVLHTRNQDSTDPAYLGLTWLEVTQRWVSAIDMCPRTCPAWYVRVRLIGRACLRHEGQRARTACSPALVCRRLVACIRKGTKGQPQSTAFMILAQYGMFGSWEGKYWWSEGAPKGNRNRWLSDNCLFERVR